MHDFLTMTATAHAAIIATSPRRSCETAAAYARRLKQTTPDLSVRDAAFASRSHMSSIRKIPEFMPLSSSALAAMNAILPRQERESGTSYARRLKNHAPSLSVRDVAAAAKVSVSYLERLPEFRHMPTDVRTVPENTPPQQHHDTGLTFVRPVQQRSPALSISDVTRASDANLSSCPPTQESERAREAALMPSDIIPRRKSHESGLAYARRLKKNLPELSVRVASALSGVTVSNLRSLPEYMPLSAMAQAAMAAISPRGADETATDYASRLKEQAPELSVKDAAAAAGVGVAKIRAMPAFLTLTGTAWAAMNAISPRAPDEPGLAYVRRLKKGTPALSAQDAAIASGGHVSNIRKMPEFSERQHSVKQAGTLSSSTTSEPDMSSEQEIVRKILREMLPDSPKNGQTICSPHSIAPLQTTGTEERREAVLSPEDIDDMARLLLRRKGVFNNQLGDIVPGLLMASAQLPANVVIDIEERQENGTTQIHTFHAFGDNRPPQDEQFRITLRLHRALNLSLHERDATAHYSYLNRDGNFISMPFDGDCFYSAVVAGLRQCGLSGYSVAGLRNMAADAFQANPMYWLGQIEQDVLLSEFRSARSALADVASTDRRFTDIDAEPNGDFRPPFDRTNSSSSAMDAMSLNTRRSLIAPHKRSWQHPSRRMSHLKPPDCEEEPDEKAFRENLGGFLIRLPGKIGKIQEINSAGISNNVVEDDISSSAFRHELDVRVAEVIGMIWKRSMSDLHIIAGEEITTLLRSEMMRQLETHDLLLALHDNAPSRRRHDRINKRKRYAAALQSLIDELKNVLSDNASLPPASLRHDEQESAYAFLPPPFSPAQRAQSTGGETAASALDEAAPQQEGSLFPSSPRSVTRMATSVLFPQTTPSAMSPATTSALSPHHHIEMQLNHDGLNATVKWPLSAATSCSSLLLNFLR